MGSESKQITNSISSEIKIYSTAETVWENITNVKIEDFSDPVLFRILGIPRPLKADLISTGQGGKRIAYFDSGKRFIQEITTWNPLHEYAFNFNPEKGFKVGHFFDLSDGIFRIPSGSYRLTKISEAINLELSTTYSLDKRVYPVFNFPVRSLLTTFQRYLLRSIKTNSERDGKH